ncbi:MAG: YvaD family protein [Parvibaculum sp.]|uniref:DUF5360 family protein n=1 Tax=Parvibaculum sp. TaxID=2024848 RepID=UPI0025D10491|nr:DUF5360 family protein [Parvibaculum sp.]MCE9650027.1 YvaD family protein [Parvibaculum sp.]
MTIRQTGAKDLPNGLTAFLLLTDIGFLVYWSVTALHVVGAIHLPPDYLFKDYDNPLVFAWNWSFMPLDLALSLAGLTGMALWRRGHPAARALVAFSLALTFCAGLMAISFWAIAGDFDLDWWLPNLLLTLWPLLYLPKLARG